MAHDSITAFETEHLGQRQRESFMKRTLFIGSAVVFLAASSIALAQVTVDVSKITCDQLVKYEIADPKQSPFGSAAIIRGSTRTRLLINIKRYKASTSLKSTASNIQTTSL